MKELEMKYIELLLKRCINFNNSKILFISYWIEDDFVFKLVEKAKEMGIDDVYLCNDSLKKRHDVLSKITLDEIDDHPEFNKKEWNEYALKGASFLILKTEIPNLMKDIDPKKIARANYVDRRSKSTFEKMQLEFKIPWCIATIPNSLWAKSIFPDDNHNEAYNKLFQNICSICMVDTKNPIENWNLFLKEQQKIVEKLNDLQISKMHYKNSLGTDIIVELDENAVWTSAGNPEIDMIVNMPTYEIFSTPNFHKTNGIVYNSKPLIYNGEEISDFYLEFKDGKVINYSAKKGESLLSEIINSDEYSCYLGEIALVNHDSPISNTGITFRQVTIDENSSCHMALGTGFSECIKNSENFTSHELLKRGVNPSRNHVDFMIGTSDLNIEAETNKGKVLILKNGNLNI